MTNAAQLTIFNYTDFVKTIQRIITYQVNNRFAILDSPLGASNVTEGMTQDLKDDDGLDISTPYYHHLRHLSSDTIPLKYTDKITFIKFDEIPYLFTALHIISKTYYIYLLTKDIITPKDLTPPLKQGMDK